MLAATAIQRDAPAPLAGGPGSRRRRRHAEDPDDRGRALCGARMPRDAVRSGDGECPLCHAIISGARNWNGR